MNGMAEEIRVQFGEMDRKRDEGLTTPSDILRFNDISYGSDLGQFTRNYTQTTKRAADNK